MANISKQLYVQSSSYDITVDYTIIQEDRNENLNYELTFESRSNENLSLLLTEDIKDHYFRIKEIRDKYTTNLKRRQLLKNLSENDFYVEGPDWDRKIRLSDRAGIDIIIDTPWTAEDAGIINIDINRTIDVDMSGGLCTISGLRLTHASF